MPHTGLLRRLLPLWLLLWAGCAQAGLFLWHGEREGQPISLIGSVHLGRASLYPLPQPMEQAYAAADTLVVEVDASDPAALADALPLTRLPEAVKLSSLLTRQQRLQLSQALRQAGLKRSEVEGYKPWFLALLLAAQQMQKAGLSSAYGVDLHFLKRAKQDGKRIVQLESARAQFELLDSLPPKDGIALLWASIRPATLERSRAQILAMVNAWQRGNLRGMRLAMESDLAADRASEPALRRISTLLLGTRNKAMADKIDALQRERTADGPPPLVLVGAGHMIGPDSLVQQLSQRGYKLTRQ